MTTRCRFACALMAVALTLVARPARAQDRDAALVRARRLLLLPDPDSAILVLDAAFPGLAAEQRGRAFLLYGVAKLAKDDTLAARRAFEQSVIADTGLTVDDDLESGGPGSRDLFAAVRNAHLASLRPPEPSRPALSASLVVPADTQLPFRDGRLVLRATVSYQARVITYATPADVPNQMLWADTQAIGVPRAVVWNLRRRDGQFVGEGNITVYVRAVDAESHASELVQGTLRVTRMPTDTAATPPPPAALPETTVVRRAPRALLWGLGLGAATALVPSALGSKPLNSGLSTDATAYAVAGAVSLSGVMGFLKGRRTRIEHANIRLNLERRQQHQRDVQRIRAANSAALENRAVRVVQVTQ